MLFKTPVAWAAFSAVSLALPLFLLTAIAYVGWHTLFVVRVISTRPVSAYGITVMAICVSVFTVTFLIELYYATTRMFSDNEQRRNVMPKWILIPPAVGVHVLSSVLERRNRPR